MYIIILLSDKRIKVNIFPHRVEIYYAVKFNHDVNSTQMGYISERCDSKWDDLRKKEHLHQSAEQIPQRSAG